MYDKIFDDGQNHLFCALVVELQVNEYRTHKGFKHIAQDLDRGQARIYQGFRIVQKEVVVVQNLPEFSHNLVIVGVIHQNELMHSVSKSDQPQSLIVNCCSLECCQCTFIFGPVLLKQVLHNNEFQYRIPEKLISLIKNLPGQSLCYILIYRFSIGAQERLLIFEVSVGILDDFHIYDIGEGGMSECLDQVPFVFELVVYTLLEVCVDLGEIIIGMGVLVDDKIDFQEWLFEDVQEIEKQLTVIELPRVKIECADETLDNISMDFTRNILKSINLGVLVVQFEIGLLVIRFIDAFNRSIFEGRGQLVQSFEQNVLIQVFTYRFSMEIGITYDIFSHKIELVFIGLGFLEEDLHSREHFQHDIANELIFLVIANFVELVHAGSQNFQDFCYFYLGDQMKDLLVVVLVLNDRFMETTVLDASIKHREPQIRDICRVGLRLFVFHGGGFIGTLVYLALAELRLWNYEVSFIFIRIANALQMLGTGFVGKIAKN